MGRGHYASARLQQDLTEAMIKILSNNPDDHFDLLELRHSIEGDCAYNVALAEADAAFHLAIAEASHNLIFFA